MIQTDTRPVFGYVRVSTVQQECERQEKGIPERQRSLPDGLDTNALELFYDHGISGWSGKTRPGFEEMLAQLQAGQASALIVDTSSRLTRQGIRAALQLFFTLEDVQTRLFTTQGREYTFDLGGLISLMVDAEADERYSATLSHNISTGKADKAADGRPYHGSLPPGYRQEGGQLVATDDLPLITEAHHRFAVKRETYKAICAFLTDELSDEVLDRLKNRTVTRDSLRRWLGHPLYLGFLRHRGELHQAKHTPAVSLELFEATQRRLDENREYNIRPPREWPFSGIARCGLCGRSLRLHPVKQRHGHTYTYLRCANPDCNSRHQLPIASAFEANAITGLAGIGFALLEILMSSDDFGTPREDAPTVDETRAAFHEAQSHFEELGGAVADGALTRNDPRYISAKTLRDDARSAVELASRDAKSHRDELFALAQRILSLSSLAAPDVKFADDGPSVTYGDEEILYPERALPRILLGWQAACFEERKNVIHESLIRLLATRDEMTFHFRVPLPLSITLSPGIESVRSDDVRSLEEAGFGRVGQFEPSL